MDELIKTFHIEGSMLLAQIVNFAIVLFVLYRFAYKPVLKMLNDRTTKIEKGLKDSDEAAQKLEDILKKEKEVLTNAKKESQEIIKKFEGEARENADSIIAKAKEQNEKMLEDARKSIEQEKSKMLFEVKSEIAGLVVAATEKIIGEKLDSEKDREMIEKAIK